MSSEQFAAVVTIVVGLLAIVEYMFGWGRWLFRRRKPQQLRSDDPSLRARIRLATGPGTGFMFRGRAVGDSTVVILRNEGQHPAYNVRPEIETEGRKSPGHANGTTIPPHEERRFEFPLPHHRTPADPSRVFRLTAPYRDGTGEHTFTMRFRFEGSDFPQWRPVIESEDEQ